MDCRLCAGDLDGCRTLGRVSLSHLRLDIRRDCNNGTYYFIEESRRSGGHKIALRKMVDCERRSTGTCANDTRKKSQKWTFFRRLKYKKIMSRSQKISTALNTFFCVADVVSDDGFLPVENTKLQGHASLTHRVSTNQLASLKVFLSLFQLLISIPSPMAGLMVKTWAAQHKTHETTLQINVENWSRTLTRHVCWNKAHAHWHTNGPLFHACFLYVNVAV